jgi:hypothetical protein
LTRDFIVPLYTGTEPDIVPEASVEQLETGRTNFNEGSKLTGTDKTLEQNIKDDHKAFNDYRKSIGQSTIPLDNAFIKMWQRTRLNEGGSVERQGFAPGGYIRKAGSRYALQIGSKNSPTFFYKSYPTKSEAEKVKKLKLKEIENKIKNTNKGYFTGPELVEYIKNKKGIDTSISSISGRAKRVGIETKKNIFGTGNSLLYKIPNDKQLNQIYSNQLKATGSTEAGKKAFNERYSRIKELLRKGNSQAETNRIISKEFPEVSSVNSSLTKASKELRKEGVNIVKGTTQEKLGINVVNKLKSLYPDIDFNFNEYKYGVPETDKNFYKIKSATGKIAEYSAQRNKNIRTTSSGEAEKKIREAKKIISQEEGYLTKKGISNLDLSHRASLDQLVKLKEDYLSSNLGIDPQDINRIIVKPVENTLKDLYSEQSKISKKAAKVKTATGEIPKSIQKELSDINLKINNLTASIDNRLNPVLIDEITLEPKIVGVDYSKSVDLGIFNKPVKELTKTELEFIKTKTLPEVMKTQSKVSKEEMKKLSLNILENKDIPEKNKEATNKFISNLTNYLNENPNEVKAFRTAGIICRRSAGGKVDVECLAENIIKETEKLETGTDLQKASALNKFKNATKLGAGLAEEVIGFGKGVAGRTLTPLVALNSALEQWTSGDIKEGFRKIADVLDPTTLVGDPFGFGKSRMEGTQEDVKKIIGEKNYKGFENIKAAADEYNQYLETKKKFERAKSSAEGAYDPLSPGVDTAYLTDLEKQKNILEKNITGTKYGDVEDNLLNYGDLIYKNILKKFPDAPDSSKYVYKKAAIEKLENAFGIDIIDLYRDDLNKKFGPDLNIIDIQQEKLKPLSEEQQNVIESSGAVGAAEGGRIGLSEGGGPKISRRGFLGFLAGAAAAPFAGKLMKGKKTAQAVKIGTKVLPKVADMPEWFPSLVARIEKEGIDISPKATSVEDIRTIKKIEVPVLGKEKPDIIKMTQYPNGAIHIEADVYGGSFDSPFDLHYRPPKSDIDLETGKQIVEPGEFSVIETRPRPVYDPHSADYELEYENMSVKDAISDLERVEKIATGKRIHPKRVEQREKARADVEDKPYEDIINRYGDRDIPDWWDPSDYASGGRVKFSGGGKVKFARMITDILGSLRQKLSFSSHLEKLYGTEKAKEKILSPYRLPEGTNKSQHSDILMYIDESRQNLPKEYNDLQNILNEIEKDISNYDYISADKKGRTLLDRLPESFNFEKLSQDLFPMEDPLNNAIILMDPQRNNMRGRFVNRVRVDPETKRGIIETFDTFDTENKKWLSEDEWKLKGAESYEKGKEGLN